MSASKESNTGTIENTLLWLYRSHISPTNLIAIMQKPRESVQSYFERVGELGTEALLMTILRIIM